MCSSDLFPSHDTRMPTLCYCATLNNHTPEDVATLRTPRSELSYIIVGHEVGDSGTPHLQIYFQLAKAVRFNTIRSWDVFSRMHLESARGSDEDNFQYCSKQGNYFEIGTRKHNKPGIRTDLLSVKKATDNGESYVSLLSSPFRPDHPSCIRSIPHPGRS